MKPVVNRKWRKNSPADHKAYGEKRERDLKITESDDRPILDKKIYIYQLNEYFKHCSNDLSETKETLISSDEFKNFLNEYYVVDWDQVQKWNKELFSKTKSK